MNPNEKFNNLKKSPRHVKLVIALDYYYVWSEMLYIHINPTYTSLYVASSCLLLAVLTLVIRVC